MQCLANGTLPDGGVPGVPTDVGIALIAGSDAADMIMAKCCSPNPVHVAAGCYEWCLLPNSLAKSVDQAGDFSRCLRANGWHGTTAKVQSGSTSGGPSADSRNGAGAAAATPTVTRLLLGTILLLGWMAVV